MFRSYRMVLVLLSLTAPVLGQGKKVALVVGINKYHHSELNRPAPLEYAEADAEDFAQELRKSGYEVVLLKGKQATLEAIRTQLDTLRKKPGEGGIFVVALAGHGVQPESTKEAYFCPYDADQRFVPRDDPNKDPWDYWYTVGSYRVFRGGGWSVNGSYCRSAYRSWFTPSNRLINLGLRVALVPSER